MPAVDTSKIHLYTWLGRKDKNWYAQCQELFTDLFGPEKLDLVCKLFAATSINTSIKSNITLFRKAYYEIENGLPISNYLPSIKTQLQYIREGLPLSGRKINSFARAMAGDHSAVVVDIWLTRAFGLDVQYFRQTKDAAEGVGRNRSSSPSDKQYTLIETWVRTEAVKMGLQPRELSAILWSGVRIYVAGDRDTHYKDRLRQSLINLFNVI